MASVHSKNLSTLLVQKPKRIPFDPEQKNFGTECVQGDIHFIISKDFYDNTIKEQVQIDQSGYITKTQDLLIKKNIVKRLKYITSKLNQLLMLFLYLLQIVNIPIHILLAEKGHHLCVLNVVR